MTQLGFRLSRVHVLLLFCALVASATATTAWCPPADVLPVRAVDSLDFVPSVLLFAGRASTQQFLRVTFRDNVSRAVVHLPPRDPLLTELGGGEIDAVVDAVTMPRLFTTWRDHDALLRAAPVATAVAGFNLAANSAWWLRYAYVVYTGAELLAYHRNCASEGLVATLESSSVPGVAAADVWNLAERFRFSVRRTNTTADAVIVSDFANIRIRVDLDRAQTLVAPAILADLIAAPNRALYAARSDQPGRPLHLILHAAEAREDLLIAPDLTQVNATDFIIGHLLARRLLSAWAANENGVVAVALARSDPSLTGVGLTLVGASIVVAYLLAFWTTTLSGAVSLDPETLGGDDARRQRQRTLRHLILLAVAGGLTHILGITFVGTGAVLASNLVVAIRTYALGFVLPGSVINALLLAMAAFRIYVLPESSNAEGAWSVLVATHCALVTRSIVIAVLPAAARSLFSALVLTAASLILVNVPAVYLAAVGIARIGRSYRDRPHELPAWDLALAGVSIVTFVLNFLGAYYYLVLPLLLTINARFSTQIIETAALVVASLPVFVGSLVSSFEARTEFLEQAESVRA